MKKTLLLIFWQFCLLSVMNVYADVVTLKDGRQIAGVVESGTTREIRIKAGDNPQVVGVDQIQSIKFDAPAEFAAQPVIAALPQTITIPIGTEVAIRTIDRIASKNADLNKEYAASLDDPVIVNGVTVVPVNASAVLRVTDVKQPKGLKAITEHASISFSLAAVTINGQRINVETDKVDSQAGTRAKRTLTGALIGAGAGAGIGAAVGGGLGAGIGSGIGAASGAISAMATGKNVEVLPETRFTCRLRQPVEIRSQETPQ